MNALTKSGDFTKSARRRFKQHGECPYCGSFNYGLEGKQIADGDTLSNRIFCSDCEKMWWEIYKLQNIEPAT